MNLPKPCPMCGNPVPVTKKPGVRGGRQATYCSLSCRGKKDYWNRVVPNKPAPRFVSCAVCSKPFATRIQKQKYCSDQCRFVDVAVRQSEKWRLENPKVDVYRYVCDWCGGVIERNTALGGSKRYHGHCSKEAQAVRYRAKTTKKRSGVKPSRVSVEALVAAYGAVCAICSEAIDLELPRTSRFGATVDHIHPLSKGGSDDFDNLQLAHWICNNRKSDKVTNG